MLDALYQSLDPVAFALGPFQVRWYGIAYILGFLAAGCVVYRNAKRWKLSFELYDVTVFICWCAFGIVIGARLGYCLFYGDGYYWSHPLEVLAVNKGGMSFHGGLIGVLVAGALYAAWQKVSLLSLADLVVCGVPLGLFFGRLANFVNGELYGAPTSLPIGVDFTGSGTFYHPSQLYEAFLEGLVIFLVLFALSRRVPARPQGTYLGTFLVLYACFRMLIEFVRLPDAQLGYFFGSWGTMGQLLCIPMLAGGVALLVYARCSGKAQRL